MLHRSSSTGAITGAVRASLQGSLAPLAPLSLKEPRSRSVINSTKEALSSPTGLKKEKHRSGSSGKTRRRAAQQAEDSPTPASPLTIATSASPVSSPTSIRIGRPVSGYNMSGRSPLAPTFVEAKAWTGDKDLLASCGGVNQHCSISTDGDAATEIRTKVFRMGAPLLRSTIPVILGTSRGPVTEAMMSARNERVKEDRGEDDDSDVETVLSLSDDGREECGALSVTLDFPC